MATRTDVAKRANVSTATVSHVVNGKESVGPEIRERVLRAIRELGYRPNHIARSLKTKKTGELALFSTDITNPYYAEVACGVEREARELGYMVCIVTSAMAELHKSLLLNRQFDGIIVQSNRLAPEDLNELAIQALPVVLIAGSEEWRSIEPSVTQITIDIKGGARKLFDYMLDRGHKRISFLSSQNLESGSTRDMRMEAYAEALADRGLALDPELLYLADSSPEDIYAAVTRMLGVEDLPSAVFAGNDANALPAIAAVRDAGLSVPGDVSVAGFDNLTASRYYSPKLTTVDIPKYGLGQTAVRLLFRKIAGEEVENLIVPTELVVRESVTPRGGSVSGSR
ncbi:MAG: LacI family DNA-binding transcriptional regulator [Rectinemataceae bacterium]